MAEKVHILIDESFAMFSAWKFREKIKMSFSNIAF